MAGKKSSKKAKKKAKRKKKKKLEYSSIEDVPTAELERQRERSEASIEGRQNHIAVIDAELKRRSG